jgi:hypothetical protein
MLAPFVGLATGSTFAGDPPSAAPSHFSLYYYSGTKVGMQWKYGDTDASCECVWSDGWQVDGDGTAPDGTITYLGTVAYPINQKDTGKTIAAGGYYFVRHVKNGQYSSWVGSVEA